MVMRDLYEILGVDRRATREEIRHAYQRQAREHHPDRENGDGERMAEVNQAYAVLSDEVARARYDRTGQVNGRPTIESKARDMLFSALAQVLAQADPNVDVIACLKAAFQESEQKARDAIRESQVGLSTLQDQLDMIADGGLFDPMRAQLLRNAQGQLESLGFDLEAIKAARKMLEGCSYGRLQQVVFDAVSGGADWGA